MMTEFWKIEEFNTVFKSKADEYCEKHFLNTFSRDFLGRMMVRLPLKENVLESLSFPLGKFYGLALRALLAIERKFKEYPILKERYCEFIQIYQDLGT